MPLSWWLNKTSCMRKLKKIIYFLTLSLSIAILTIKGVEPMNVGLEPKALLQIKKFSFIPFLIMELNEYLVYESLSDIESNIHKVS